VAVFTSSAVPGQQPKGVDAPTAKIFLACNVSVGVSHRPKEIEIDGRKITVHGFDLAKRTKLTNRPSIVAIQTQVYLQTDQDVKTVLDDWQKAKQAYFKQLEQKMVAEKDKQKREQLEDEHRRALSFPPPFALIEGTVVGVQARPIGVGKNKTELHELVVSGKARILEAKEREKWLPTGGFIVEGEAFKGNFEVGKETYAVAIKNGKLPVVLTGELAKKHADITGTIRVIGEIRPEATRLLLAVEALEVLKK
jgi:hypothetical protein